MGSLNKVMLIGHVGHTPKISDKGETKIAKFTLATNERRKGDEHVEWHDVTAFGKIAEIVEKNVTKGRLLYVEGRISTHDWEDRETGAKKRRTEVLASSIVFLGRKGDTDEPSRKDDDDIPF